MLADVKARVAALESGGDYGAALAKGRELKAQAQEILKSIGG
jgi:hypothetical protein